MSFFFLNKLLLYHTQNDFLRKKNSQNISCFKITSKLVFYCHIFKIVLSDYDFKFFKKIKIVVTSYGVKLIVKIMVSNYDLKKLKKKRVI